MEEMSQIPFIDLPGPDYADNQEDVKHRQWLKRRSTRFTGSRIKHLMTCDRSASKKSWDDASKLFAFGETAIKYIFEVGMTRKTAIIPQPPFTPWQMKFGNENEPKVVEQLMTDGVISDYKKCDLVTYEGLDSLAATPDGEIMVEDVRMGIEIKSCVSWDGFYDRMSEPVNEKHNDFWQVQTEMLVLNVPELLYVVALPQRFDVYEKQVIKASPFHQNLIIKRAEIADLALKLWTGDKTIKNALAEACAEFKD